MNYALAKELKDAGFPQTSTAMLYGPGYGGGACVPTLDELIEECPKSSPQDSNQTFVLAWVSPLQVWIAGYEAYELWGEVARGSTRRSAVARLYIALNGKKRE